MDLLLDVRELREINELTAWWNACVKYFYSVACSPSHRFRQVFAGATSQDDSIADDAPLAVIRKRRDDLERLAAAATLEGLAAATTPTGEEEAGSSGDGLNAGSPGTADQGGAVGENSPS